LKNHSRQPKSGKSQAKHAAAHTKLQRALPKRQGGRDFDYIYLVKVVFCRAGEYKNSHTQPNSGGVCWINMCIYGWAIIKIGVARECTANSALQSHA